MSSWSPRAYNPDPNRGALQELEEAEEEMERLRGEVERLEDEPLYPSPQPSPYLNLTLLRFLGSASPIQPWGA